MASVLSQHTYTPIIFRFANVSSLLDTIDRMIKLRYRQRPRELVPSFTNSVGSMLSSQDGNELAPYVRVDGDLLGGLETMRP